MVKRKNPAEWQLTQHMRDRMQGNVAFISGETDTYKGYKVIKRDSKILGGVYLGSAEREAILVDEGTNFEALYKQVRKIFKITLDDKMKAGLKADYNLKELIWLTAVYITVSSHFEITKPELVAKVLAEFKQDQIIPLDLMIKLKFGVCRHLNLVNAALLEKLIKDGELKGKVSIDRNYDPGKGAHAWARYTSPSGDVFILDSMQKTFGPLETIQDGSKLVWNYARETDPGAKSRTVRSMAVYEVEALMGAQMMRYEVEAPSEQEALIAVRERGGLPISIRQPGEAWRVTID